VPGTALICYKRHLAGGTTPPPFGERLDAIAALPETLTLDPSAAPLSPAVIEKGSVFLDLSKGRRELMTRAESIETFLPDWGSIPGQHPAEAKIPPQALDDAAMKQLWTLSEDATGVRF
jgi:hypothetical protein